jgi:transcriptional regulator with XRE-family HTH domain
MQTMPLMSNFVANLRTACERRNLSQRALAESSGVHYVTVNRIFQQKLSPSIEVCEKLAIAAGVESPEKIFRKPTKIA